MSFKGPNLIDDVCPRVFTTRRSIQIIAGCILILAILAACLALKSAKPVMLPLASAFVISLILAPAAAGLRRFGLSEGVASAVMTVVALGAIVSFLTFSGRPAIAWAERAPELVQQAREKLSGLEEAVTKVKEVSGQVEEISKIGESKDERSSVTVVQEERKSSPALAAPGAIVQFLFTWVLVFFLLSSRTDLKRKFVALYSGYSGKARAIRMFNGIEQRIGSYMLIMLSINIVMGIAMAAAAWSFGLPSPLVWGLLAGVLNFIPYIGPALMTVMLGLAGIVHYDEPLMALAPMGAFILINFLESNFVTPMLLGVKLRVTPLAIILSVSLFTLLWGPLGGVLAIPLLLVFKTVCDSTPVLLPVGVLIGELKPIERRPFGPLRTLTSRQAA